MQQFKTSFAEAFKFSRILESLDNYSRAGSTTTAATPTREAVAEEELLFQENESFWKMILANPDKYYGAEISLNQFTVSTWVARVPGLYWTKDAQVLRQFSEGMVESVSNKWMHYTPAGKSALVLGGIGTLKLSPGSDNNRIISLNYPANVSQGIPAIISNQLWNRLSLEDGLSVNIKKATWTAMEKEWAQRFPFMQGLPRAYLKLDGVDKIEKVNKAYEYAYQPFSVMEYTDGDALFYDYVFCNVNNRGDEDFSANAASFFDDYKTSHGRNGNYLIAAEPDGKLFKANFSSPEELSANYGDSARTNLALLESRIRENCFKGTLVDDLIKKLSGYYHDTISIKRIAGYNNIFLKDDPPAIMVNNLVRECLKNECLEVLVDHVAIEFPEILNKQ